MRLLLVDDDAGLRALLGVTFELATSRSSRPTARRPQTPRSPRARPDVIVLDVRMPGMDGLAFCRRLKDDPATRDIRVVLLTGSDDEIPLVAADAAGADAFLRKPFSPLELLGRRRARSPAAWSAVPAAGDEPAGADEQLLLYARDLRHLLEIERSQRVLLERVPRDRGGARDRARDEGHRHARPSHASSATPRARARASTPTSPPTELDRVRLPPPRRGQDRDP